MIQILMKFGLAITSVLPLLYPLLSLSENRDFNSVLLILVPDALLAAPWSLLLLIFGRNIESFFSAFESNLIFIQSLIVISLIINAYLLMRYCSVKFSTLLIVNAFVGAIQTMSMFS